MAGRRLSEHAKSQIARAVRLLAAVLASQPIASALASSTLVRYPLAAALVAAFEVAVREGFPVKPLPKISSIPAAEAVPPGQAGAVSNPPSPPLDGVS